VRKKGSRKKTGDNAPQPTYAFCEDCGGELDEGGACIECGSVRQALSSGDDDGSSLTGKWVLELPYGYKVDCVREDIYHNISIEADFYKNAGDTFLPDDWSSLRELLQLSISIYLEDDPSVKRQLMQLRLQLMRSLGITRHQRVEMTGTSLSPIDLLRREAERAEEYYEKHRGEFTWKARCPKCSTTVIGQMNAPHPMFSCGDDGDTTVWNESLVPLIKRYYAFARNRGYKTRRNGADYTRRDWMDRPEYDGGLSVPDAARILNLSPLGMLYTLWLHSSNSGNEKLPSLKEMLGFEFDLDKPKTLLPYLPEGYTSSEGFAREMMVYQKAKKKVKALREWRRKHRMLMLWWTIKDRLLFFDYFGHRLVTERKWKTWYAQIPSTLDDKSLERDGRGTGKSERVKMSAVQAGLYLAVTHPGDSVLLATPDEAHTREHYEKVLGSLERDEFFVSCLAPRNSRKMSRGGGMIHFAGGSGTIYFRYPGTNTKDAFALQQYHASALIVDEIGKWPKAAEDAVLSSVKTQQCVCTKYFGVVISENASLPIYYYTKWPHRYARFRGHIYSISSLINVYDYNLEKHRELLDSLGGSVRAEAFARQVLGSLGTTTETEFTPDEVERACVIGYADGGKEQPYRVVRLGADMQRKYGSDTSLLFGSTMPGLDIAKKDSRNCMFAYDYGSTAPSELWVLVRVPGDGEVWRLSLRVEMVGVDDDYQVTMIDRLADYYNPQFIAMDMTGTHNRVAAIMMSAHTGDLRQQNYKDIIWPVNFQAQITVHYFEEKPTNPNIRVVRTKVNGQTMWVQKQPIRAWAMAQTHLWLQRKKILLPVNDTALKKEFLSLKVKRKEGVWGASWEGVDHNIAAFQCFLVCHWQNYELREPSKRTSYDYTQTFEPVGIGYDQMFGAASYALVA